MLTVSGVVGCGATGVRSTLVTAVTSIVRIFVLWAVLCTVLAVFLLPLLLGIRRLSTTTRLALSEATRGVMASTLRMISTAPLGEVARFARVGTTGGG